MCGWMSYLRVCSAKPIRLVSFHKRKMILLCSTFWIMSRSQTDHSPRSSINNKYHDVVVPLKVDTKQKLLTNLRMKTKTNERINEAPNNGEKCKLRLCVDNVLLVPFVTEQHSQCMGLESNSNYQQCWAL